MILVCKTIINGRPLKNLNFIDPDNCNFSKEQIEKLIKIGSFSFVHKDNGDNVKQIYLYHETIIPDGPNGEAGNSMESDIYE